MLDIQAIVDRATGSPGSLSLVDTTVSGNTSGFGAGIRNDGGPTLTHALLPGSPAIDKVNNASCLPYIAVALLYLVEV